MFGHSGLAPGRWDRPAETALKGGQFGGAVIGTGKMAAITVGGPPGPVFQDRLLQSGRTPEHQMICHDNSRSLSSPASDRAGRFAQYLVEGHRARVQCIVGIVMILGKQGVAV